MGFVPLRGIRLTCDHCGYRTDLTAALNTGSDRLLPDVLRAGWARLDLHEPGNPANAKVEHRYLCGRCWQTFKAWESATPLKTFPGPFSGEKLDEVPDAPIPQYREPDPATLEQRP